MPADFLTESATALKKKVHFNISFHNIYTAAHIAWLHMSESGLEEQQRKQKYKYFKIKQSNSFLGICTLLEYCFFMTTFYSDCLHFYTNLYFLLLKFSKWVCYFGFKTLVCAFKHQMDLSQVAQLGPVAHKRQSYWCIHHQVVSCTKK